MEREAQQPKLYAGRWVRTFLLTWLNVRVRRSHKVIAKVKHSSKRPPRYVCYKTNALRVSNRDILRKIRKITRPFTAHTVHPRKTSISETTAISLKAERRDNAIVTVESRILGDPLFDYLKPWHKRSASMMHLCTTEALHTSPLPLSCSTAQLFAKQR